MLNNPTRCHTGDELDEVVVQADAGVRIKDRGARIGVEVGRNDFVFGVTDDAGPLGDSEAAFMTALI